MGRALRVRREGLKVKAERAAMGGHAEAAAWEVGGELL